MKHFLVIYDDCGELQSPMRLHHPKTAPPEGVIEDNICAESATLFPSRSAARDAINRTRLWERLWNKDWGCAHRLRVIACDIAKEPRT